MSPLYSLLKAAVNGPLSLFGLQLVRPAAAVAQLADTNTYKDAVRRRCEQILMESHAVPQGTSSENYSTWQTGLIDEFEFWYVTVALDGWNWKKSYQWWLTRTFDFQIGQIVQEFHDQEMQALDVGAGPLILNRYCDAL